MDAMESNQGSKENASSEGIVLREDDIFNESELSTDVNSKTPSGINQEPFHIDRNYVDPGAYKAGNINIYGEDIGPKFYHIKGNIVTPPIISKNLPEAFSYLPVFGRPNSQAELEDFQNNKIREYVGCDLNDEEFENLAKYCSPVHLKTGKELTMPTKVPKFGILPENKKSDNEDGDHLNIVKKYKLRVEKDTANLYVKKLKYRGMRILPQSQAEADDENDTEPPLEPGKDLLFRVRIYRPFFYGKERYNSRHSVFSCDLWAPGRARLSALRERFVCANDADLRLDVSDAPHDAPTATAKELFPSGFMFINNVFYVDEGEGRIDYSAPIREWAAKRGFGVFPKRDMNSVRLDELQLKLGHPEVYVHQGHCEHLFTLSEVRLLGAADGWRAAAFPRHGCAQQHQTVYCTTCAEFGARWAVRGCRRVPFEPAFFCDACLKLYLYSDGAKLGPFEAYSFRGNEINPLKPIG